MIYAVVAQLSPSLSFTLKLTGTVLLSGSLFVLCEPLVLGIVSLTEGRQALGGYASAVLKATGIAILSHICADACRDAGHASLGNAVILAAKLEIVIISLPIVERIIGYASEIMGVR